MSEMRSTILINGEYIENNEKRPVVNPAFEKEVVGEVSMGKSTDVKDAITAADNAFKKWSNSSISDRRKSINLVVEELESRIEELTSIFVRESGKTLIESKIDIKRSIDVLREVPLALAEWNKATDLSNSEQQLKILKRPRGVATIITPWNSPVILTMKRVVPAVLTGNTVVVKPATNCPLAISEVLSVFAKHLPAGVLNIVTGSGAEIGDHLVSDTRVKTISFVGGTATGKKIVEQSAASLTKLHLELGGNDAAIIMEDALLDKTNIEKLKSAILKNAGQVCSAVKRIYVHESRYDELLEKLEKAFNKVIVGEGIHPESTMGTLNNKNQFQYIKELIKNIQDNGGDVRFCGSKLNESKWEEGNFILPAIVTNVDQKSRIVQEEQFGPIIPIMKYKDVSEAINNANDSIYGLRASVWTEDVSKAEELSYLLESGAVFYNNHTIFSDLAIDFAGVKESGIGRETNHYNFEHFNDSFGFAN